jgi:hypothetical protein
MILQAFYGKGPHLLLRSGSGTEGGPITISDLPNPKLLCKFYSTNVIQKCSRWLRNTNWRFRVADPRPRLFEMTTFMYLHSTH